MTELRGGWKKQAAGTQELRRRELRGPVGPENPVVVVDDRACECGYLMCSCSPERKQLRALEKAKEQERSEPAPLVNKVRDYDAWMQKAALASREVGRFCAYEFEAARLIVDKPIDVEEARPGDYYIESVFLSPTSAGERISLFWHVESDVKRRDGDWLTLNAAMRLTKDPLLSNLMAGAANKNFPYPLKVRDREDGQTLVEFKPNHYGTGVCMRVDRDLPRSYALDVLISEYEALKKS